MLASVRRYMATGKHIGKVVLRVREEEAAGARPQARLIPAQPRTYMHPGKTYVLVGKDAFLIPFHVQIKPIPNF